MIAVTSSPSPRRQSAASTSSARAAEVWTSGGSNPQRISLDEVAELADARAAELIASTTLQALLTIDPRKAQLVELDTLAG